MPTSLRLAFSSWAGSAALVLATSLPAAEPSSDHVSVSHPPVVGEFAGDGSAVVAVTIRASGEVDDAVALHSTSTRLAEAAVDAVRRWRFARDPVEGRGRGARPDRVLRREVVELDFRRRGVVTSLTHADSARAWFPGEREAEVRTVLR